MLQIKAPHGKEIMCSFHLTIDHDGKMFTDWMRYLQMKETQDQYRIVIEEESGPYNASTPTALFLEYESNPNKRMDILLVTNDPSSSILTQGQRNFKFTPGVGSSPQCAKVKDSPQFNRDTLKLLKMLSLKIML